MLRLLLFSHILGAIFAVGLSTTYGVWLARAGKTGVNELSFAYSTVLWIDSHIATPAFVWQLISGLLLVFAYEVATFEQMWLATSLALYVVVAVLAMAVVTPRSKRALAALGSSGPEAPEYVSFQRMMRGLSPVLGICTLGIVFLMVVKPGT